MKSFAQTIIDHYAADWAEACLYWFDEIELKLIEANGAWEQDALYEGETHPF